MRYAPVEPQLFVVHRTNLQKLLLPNSLAVLNANDILPTNADGVLTLRPNSDLFYLSGIEQEQTILLLYPDAHEEKFREILFLRQPSEQSEVWEGHKLTKEEARAISGIKRIEWLSEFEPIFHRLMCECDHVYLNSNEHKRADIVVETREARFVREVQKAYPLHDYQRLARLMHKLRVVKSQTELALIQKSCAITEAGFRRVCRIVAPGVNEMEIEAEFAHEFIRQGGQFAYNPIIASGVNACALHYVQNDQPCRKGDLLLLDVAAAYANYNADLTRTIPVTGKFSPRQKQVYDAVLRVLRGAAKAATVGKLVKDWQKEAEALMEKELLDLGLLKPSQIKKQSSDEPAFKKYFMHGIGHPLGLDVHDVGLTVRPIEAGWVLTVEPGIYIREEGFAVRLENDIVVQEGANVDLMEAIPIEAEEIEQLMRRRPGSRHSSNGRVRMPKNGRPAGVRRSSDVASSIHAVSKSFTRPHFEWSCDSRRARSGPISESMSSPHWQGVFPAITTQFKRDQSLDLEATARHADALTQLGVSGLIVLGSLGENQALRPEEKRLLIEALVKAVNGRVPVLSGVAESSTAEACRYVRDLEKLGANGFMLMPAMLYRGDPRETLAHYSTTARATGLPIMVYNNPISYANDITPEMFAELASIKNLVALKESSGNTRRITDLRNCVGDRYSIFTGVDDLVLECAILGIDGWVAGSGIAFPAENQYLWELTRAGQWEDARQIYRWFTPLLHLDTHAKFVQYIKLAVQECGLGSEWVRAPRLPLVGVERKQILKVIHDGIDNRPKIPKRINKDLRVPEPARARRVPTGIPSPAVAASS